MHRGVVRVDSTLTRKPDLVETLDEVISSGYLPQQQGLRLRGRLQFLAGAVLVDSSGRCSLPKHT